MKDNNILPVQVGGLVLMPLELIAGEWYRSVAQVRALIRTIETMSGRQVPIIEQDGRQWINLHALMMAVHVASDPSTPEASVPEIIKMWGALTRQTILSDFRDLGLSLFGAKSHKDYDERKQRAARRIARELAGGNPIEFNERRSKYGARRAAVVVADLSNVPQPKPPRRGRAKITTTDSPSPFSPELIHPGRLAGAMPEDGPVEGQADGSVE